MIVEQISLNYARQFIKHNHYASILYGSRSAAEKLGYHSVSGFQYGYYILLGSSKKRGETAKRILLPSMPYPKNTKSVISGSVDWNLRTPLPLFDTELK